MSSIFQHHQIIVNGGEYSHYSQNCVYSTISVYVRPITSAQSLVNIPAKNQQQSPFERPPLWQTTISHPLHMVTLGNFRLMRDHPFGRPHFQCTLRCSFQRGSFVKSGTCIWNQTQWSIAFFWYFRLACVDIGYSNLEDSVPETEKSSSITLSWTKGDDRGDVLDGTTGTWPELWVRNSKFLQWCHKASQAVHWIHYWDSQGSDLSNVTNNLQQDNTFGITCVLISMGNKVYTLCELHCSYLYTIWHETHCPAMRIMHLYMGLISLKILLPFPLLACFVKSQIYLNHMHTYLKIDISLFLLLLCSFLLLFSSISCVDFHNANSTCCRDEQKTLPKVCKRSLYEEFRALCSMYSRKELLSAATYRDSKMAATEHQHVKDVLFKRFERLGYGTWVHKPPEVDYFTL